MKLEDWQIQKLRETELALLQEFSSACDAMGLSWFLVQGSLLGAVRHQGFIPWDDDIDVGMLREDFDRFCAGAQKILPAHCFLQTHDTDPEYLQCFAKLRDTRTVFREMASADLSIEHGIYLDIFPFDHYPDRPIEAVWFDLRKRLMHFRMRYRYHGPQDGRLTPKNLARKTIQIFSNLFWRTPEGAFLAQERMLASVKPSKRRINAGSPWGKRECVPEELLTDRIELVFENRIVSVPAGYDAYLRHVYGDYWELPPAEKRVSHHEVSEIRFYDGSDTLEK